MYGRYNYPAGHYPYYPYHWPRPHVPLHTPSYTAIPQNRINFITNKQEPAFSINYSHPSFLIPKPDSNATDQKCYNNNLNQSEPPLTNRTHSSQTLHKLSEDELYFESLWSAEPASSTPKFRASLHLSLQLIPLKSSCLPGRHCQGEPIQTANFSGFMSQNQSTSALYLGSITHNRLHQVEKSPFVSENQSNPLRNHLIGSDSSQHLIQTNISMNNPHGHVGSGSSNSPQQYDDHNSINVSTPDYSSISSPKRLCHQQSPISQSEGPKHPDTNFTPQMKYEPEVPCPIQRSLSPSAPFLLSPTSTSSPLSRELSRKRSLPFSDSDSGDELPDVTFVTESADECCFIVSTTTPRMARELKLSPTNVSLTRMGLEAPGLCTFPQMIKQEHSPTSLLTEITDKFPSADITSENEERSSPIQHKSSSLELFERDIPLTETSPVSTELASVQSNPKQVLNRRKMPLLSVTKTKTTPSLNFNLNHTHTLARKNSTNRPGTNQYGDTPLHRLAQMGALSAVEHAVLEQQIPVNARDNAGWTALHEACSSGHKQVAVFLLQQGANPNIVSNDGTAPIHDAVTSEDFNFLKLLVSYGADPLVNQGDTSPLDMDTSDQIRAYLRETAIRRGYYHPGLPTFPDTPISPTTFIKPTSFSNSLQILRPDPLLFKQSIPAEIETDLYYISPIFETSPHSFLPTFSLPIALNSGHQFMSNFYFLPDVLNRLEIDIKEFSLILPEMSIFKFSKCEFADHIPSVQYDVFPETAKLEFVADTVLLQQLLKIQIQNMEI